MSWWLYGPSFEPLRPWSSRDLLVFRLSCRWPSVCLSWFYGVVVRTVPLTEGVQKVGTHPVRGFKSQGPLMWPTGSKRYTEKRGTRLSLLTSLSGTRVVILMCVTRYIKRSFNYYDKPSIVPSTVGFTGDVQGQGRYTVFGHDKAGVRVKGTVPGTCWSSHLDGPVFVVSFSTTRN